MTRRRRSPITRLAAVTALVAASALPMTTMACGASSRRSMATPPHEITYHDACNLQDYFDQRFAAALPPPNASDEMRATNGKGQTIGEGSYVLQDPLARRRFARLLREEYLGIARPIIDAVESAEGRVSVHVRWWDAGPIKRLRPNDDVVVITPKGAAELPPNPCVGDLLFGDRLYSMRARYVRSEVDFAIDRPTAGPTASASSARPAPPGAPPGPPPVVPTAPTPPAGTTSFPSAPSPSSSGGSPPPTPGTSF